MRLTVLQLEATWNRPFEVLARVDRLLADGPTTDLVLLPEAALTGYVSPHGSFDLGPLAEPAAGPVQKAVAAIAARYAVTLVAPSIRREGDHVYNAMIATAADGSEAFVYRKRHPWFPEEWASAGSAAPPRARLHGVLTTCFVCFDLQFALEDCRDELEAARLLLFPSAWVDDEDSRTPTLRELARRFDLWIGAANWAEGDVRVPGQGNSCIVAPDGRVVASRARGDARIDAILTP